MHAYMYAYIHNRTHATIRTGDCIFRNTYIHAYTQYDTCLQRYIISNPRLSRIRTYLHTLTHTYTMILTYKDKSLSHIHTYIHIYIHTQLYLQNTYHPHTWLISHTHIHTYIQYDTYLQRHIIRTPRPQVITRSVHILQPAGAC